MNHDIDIDALIDGDDSQRSGIFGLWVAVLVSAFFSLKDEDDYAPGARDFLFGDNEFLDFVAESMGYSPEAMRERIKIALERGDEQHGK